ncbi:MAG: hypothetical protein JF887_08955 [Candidatus Dormibacteraeota bacterium]|uniref:Peptidase C39-like domain-containing protein n=1 Tax=Candidatus Amunia macphersoniae TaxID=3127014 RepID=A0A934KDW6_9BACT|nr:hypothetical protein [Candidatus Dormibacteraeota bacterium]
MTQVAPARSPINHWSPRRALALAVLSVAVAAASACGSASSTKRDTPPPDAAATDAPLGTLAADLGFRPDVNGFPFANYGNDVTNLTNLTPKEMQDIFGNVVCSDPAAPDCTLIPPAQTWMDKQNRSMSGGHCQGMSVTALLLFKKLINPSDYGADSVASLSLANNAALQARIAESFQYQYFPGVAAGTVEGTPVEVLTALTKALTDKTVTYGLGIFKADRTGGHEITPIAVEDKGNGVSAILVYDNNYPKAIRELDIDTNANTWTYVGSTNPAEAEGEYKGDASTKTLNIDPLEPGVAKQPCPFCAPPQQSAKRSPMGHTIATVASTTSYEDIYLAGDPNNHAHLLITDDKGRRLGYAGSTFVNEIPGARVDYPKLGKDFTEAEEPEYFVPTGTALTITVDGSPIKDSDSEEIGLIGPGDDLFVDVTIGGGHKDAFSVNSDRTNLTYKSGADEKPSIQFGSDRASSDFEFTVNPSALAGGSTVGLSLSDANLSIDASAVPGNDAYDIQMKRLDANGNDLVFKHSGLTVPGGGTAQLGYASWDHAGDSIPVTVQSGGQTTQDQLSDQR